MLHVEGSGENMKIVKDSVGDGNGKIIILDDPYASEVFWKDGKIIVRGDANMPFHTQFNVELDKKTVKRIFKTVVNVLES